VQHQLDFLPVQTQFPTNPKKFPALANRVLLPAWKQNTVTKDLRLFWARPVMDFPEKGRMW
jgi:hypothetical protein